MALGIADRIVDFCDVAVLGNDEGGSAGKVVLGVENSIDLREFLLVVSQEREGEVFLFGTAMDVAPLGSPDGRAEGANVRKFMGDPFGSARWTASTAGSRKPRWADL